MRAFTTESPKQTGSLAERRSGRGGQAAAFRFSSWYNPSDKNAAARKAEPASTKIAGKSTQTTIRARYILRTLCRTIQVIKNVRRT